MTQDSIQHFEDKHNELEEIRTTRLKGQCIRSKANWIDQGEKPTKYFANLESRNYINKQILVIEKENGSITRNPQEILSETKKFYESLYTRQDIVETENIHEKLKNFIIPKLNKEESENIEGPITNTEVLIFF